MSPIMREILQFGYMQFFCEIGIALFIICFNYKKKKSFWIMTVIAVLSSFSFRFMPRIYFGLDFTYVIIVLYLFILSIFTFKEKVSVLFISCLASFSIQHFLWNTLFVLIGTLNSIWTVPSNLYFTIYILYYVVWYLMFFLFTYYKNIKIVDVSKNLGIYFIAGVTFLVVFVLSQEIHVWTIITRLYTSIAALLCTFLIYIYPVIKTSILSRRKLIEEKETLEKIIEQQSNQNEKYLETREFLNLKIHDLKHELDLLSTIRNEDCFNETIESLKKQLLVFNSFAKTGNVVVDVILTQKALLCVSKNIRFTYIVDGEALKIFSNNDIATLFGNILDNAIEASEKVLEENRIIKLHVSKKDNFLVISQTNFSNNIPVFVSKFPKSTKNNPLLHGYGLKSISYITQKYNGHMDINFSDNTFKIDLVFPL